MERFRGDVWKLLMHLLPNISKCRLIVLWNPVDGDYVDNRNAIVYEIHRRGDEVAEKVYFITPVFFWPFWRGNKGSFFYVYGVFIAQHEVFQFRSE